MDSIREIKSFIDCKMLIERVRERRILYSNISEHFRGQGRSEYELIPTISRGVVNAKDIKEKEDYLLDFLKSELKRLKMENLLRIDPLLNDKQNIWNILFQAQHLEISTRLLDWTMDWKVALWFAVENPNNDGIDGQFWVFTAPDKIHSTDTRDSFYKKDLDNLDKTYLINVPIYWSEELPLQVGDVKRQRQFGKFTISPYESSFTPLEKQPEIIPYLEKYCIPAKAKKQIRLDLEKKGIHREWLYYRDANKDILEKLEKMKTTSP